jgi:hypothetical protein
LKPRDVFALENHTAFFWAKKTRDTGKSGCLSGSVGPYDTDDLALVDGHIDAINGSKPAKSFGDAIELE